MNYKLILQLSLFGLAMAFATVFWIPTKFEAFFWIPIFVICAVIIAQKCEGKFFLNGFTVSLANCVWITGIHIAFYFTYMQNHPDLVAMDNGSFIPDHPRLRMLVMGPFIGILSGLVLGFFSFLAGLYFKKKPSPSDSGE